MNQEIQRGWLPWAEWLLRSATGNRCWGQYGVGVQILRKFFWGPTMTDLLWATRSHFPPSLASWRWRRRNLSQSRNITRGVCRWQELRRTPRAATAKRRRCQGAVVLAGELTGVRMESMHLPVVRTAGAAGGYRPVQIKQLVAHKPIPALRWPW